MLSVDAALEQTLNHFRPLEAETVALLNALGRALAQDVQAVINLPPFANSAMDGYAVRAEDVAAAARETPTRLRLVMDIPAGAVADRAVMPGEAARIMTGAPLPDGADAVVPVEQTDSAWTPGDSAPLPEAVQIYRSVKPGDYVRPAGEDIQAGQVVLRAGSLLRPQDIGILAALGYAQVNVVRQPRVTVISTGDELVDVGEALSPGKIRDVNRYVLAALVAICGGVALPLPIARDTLEAVRGVFHQALSQQPDVIISSAGVSVGAFDVVRMVLDELGHVGFWRVNLRPGKPLAFGALQGVPFFGLPGNPVSAMITFDLFVRPALLRMQRREITLPTVTAITGETFKSDGRRSYLRVTLERKDGQLVAHTTGTQSSGALMSMVVADGLLIVPEDVTLVQAGTPLPVRLLREIQ